VRPRLLVLRALGLGDFLTGVPVLRALRRALPEHELVLAAPAVLAPLVALSGAVDRLLPVGELEPVPWHGPPPEVAVDLHGNGPRSLRLLEELQPGRLVGFARPGGPRWRAGEQERQRWCRLVSEEFDVLSTPDDVMLAVPPLPSPVPGAVVVHPGSAAPSRRWPVQRFAAVARWAHAGGHQVVVTGSAGEAPLVREVARRAPLPAASVRAGVDDLASLAALVAGARLVVVGDTGMAHLASAFRTPSVVLFGPVPPSEWGPPAAGPHTTLWHGTGRGDPHGDVTDPALLRITVEEVRAAAAVRLDTGHADGRVEVSPPVARSTSRSG
jgi:ADP-heptose:LPS heptosyltransferase